MPDFFFVDRYGTCAAGTELPLQTPHYNFGHATADKLETATEVESTLRELFPDGLSLHGQRYLLERYPYGQNVVAVSPVIELVAELIRRLAYPQLPSRFQALFACETLDSARLFRSRGQPFNRIFRVRGNSHFRADMNLLSLGPTAASSLNLVHKYWKGAASSEPFWEIILPPPVQVVEQVDPPASGV